MRAGSGDEGLRRGPALLEVGLLALASIDIRAVARPAMEQLVAEVDETAHLVILQGSSVLFLDSVETTWPVRAGPRSPRLRMNRQPRAGRFARYLGR
jgi:DNA-binding IclR family transcriptional regulator